MGRRRYQHGQLILDGDRWIARFRVDEIGKDGQVRRRRKKEIIATLLECPTREMAQQKLDERLREVNGRPPALPPGLRVINVALCEPCRQRFHAATGDGDAAVTKLAILWS